MARYDDGTGFCFGCRHYQRADGTGETRETNPHAKAPKDWTPVVGTYQELTNRDIKEATCKFCSYQVGMTGGRPSHIMNIYDQRRSLIAQKFRTKESKGSWIGDAKDPPLYLQWLWSGKGKSVTITEGEIDAMSVLQAFDLKWPVVSLPNGCGSVNKALAKAYEWLDGYDSIVLMFDQDEAGRAALETAVELLPVGKVKIAKLPSDCKDANDALRKHGPKALVNAFWNAETWRPDGIVEGATFTRENVKKASAAGYTLPYPELQEKVLGLRKRELTLLTAGSGIGKSTLARELAYYLHEEHGCRIGNVFLEESNEKTVQGYVALHCGVPLGLLRQNPSLITDQQWDDALAKVVNTRMWFYDHFGSLAADNLISKLRYMAMVCKVDFTVLDHISICTSGLESGSEGERKDIDILMTRLQSLCQETGMGILAIVHLKRKPGTSFNNGGQISLSDLRGSGSLEQLSDNVYGLERDQQAEGSDCCKSTIRILKCRETGAAGEADELFYDRNIGRNVLGVDHVFDVNAETSGEEVPF